MKGIFECLPNRIFSLTRLFDLCENRRFGRWMAKREINTSLTSLEFRPNHSRVPCIPSKLLKHAKNDALGD